MPTWLQLSLGLLAAALAVADRIAPVAAPDSALQSIALHNADRRQTGRVRSGVLFFFIAAGMVSLAVLFAVLLAWYWRPWDRCLNRNGNLSPQALAKRGTVIWLVSLIVILFVASSAGGLPGWSIVGFIFSCGCVSLGVASAVVRRDSNNQPRPSRQIIPVSADAETGGAEVTTRKTEVTPPHWAPFPSPLAKTQYIVIRVCVALMLLFLILCFIVFYSWTVSDYLIWQRAPAQQVVEFIPSKTAKAIQMMYVWEAFATNMRLGVYAQLATSYCGNIFTMELEPAKRKEAIYTPFVELYKINMSIFTPSDWSAYGSVNDWFVRKINLVYRPWPTSGGSDFVVAPADSRVIVFPKISNSDIWIKGQKLTVSEIINADEKLMQPFVDGSMVICRLAPQDYHRFHATIEGTLTYSADLGGTLWSVNPDAAVSGNRAFANVRKLLIFTSPVFGRVAYVAIGATCVGSVVVGTQLQESVELGDEIGYMQFGGSTVLLLFEPGKVTLDPDLVRHSSHPVETLVKVNDVLGVATSSVTT